MDIAPQTCDEIEAERTAQGIAHGDPADAPQKCGEESWQRLQFMGGDQVAGEQKERFIGHGNAHDAEHQHGEDAHITVLCDPREQRSHVGGLSPSYPSPGSAWPTRLEYFPTGRISRSRSRSAG